MEVDYENVQPCHVHFVLELLINCHQGINNYGHNLNKNNNNTHTPKQQQQQQKRGGGGGWERKNHPTNNNLYNYDGFVL